MRNDVKSALDTISDKEARISALEADLAEAQKSAKIKGMEVFKKSQDLTKMTTEKESLETKVTELETKVKDLEKKEADKDLSGLNRILTSQL